MPVLFKRVKRSTRWMIWSVLVSTLHGFVKYLLPAHAKKLLWLASLHARLVHDELMTDIGLEKLNQTMGLSNSYTALKLPATISTTLWKQEELDAVVKNIKANGSECLTPEEADRLCSTVLKITPDWLRYDPIDMFIDLRQLFGCCPLKTA